MVLLTLKLFLCEGCQPKDSLRLDLESSFDVSFAAQLRRLIHIFSDVAAWPWEGLQVNQGLQAIVGGHLPSHFPTIEENLQRIGDCPRGRPRSRLSLGHIDLII